MSGNVRFYIKLWEKKERPLSSFGNFLFCWFQKRKRLLLGLPFSFSGLLNHDCLTKNIKQKAQYYNKIKLKSQVYINKAYHFTYPQYSVYKPTIHVD